MEVDEIRMTPEPMDIDEHNDAVTDCVSVAPLGPRRRRLDPDANVRGAKQLMSLPDLLLRRDAAEYFTNACGRMAVKWMSLETTTALLEGTTSSDPRIIFAFKTLDRLFDSESDIYIVRMAYIQLGRLLRRLEIMIKSERQAGILHRERRYQDSSISIDMYMSAKEPVKHIGQVRKQLIERRVISMRWSILVGSTPFLSLIFSEAAEKIIGETNYGPLRKAAEEIVRRNPRIVHVCARLDEMLQSGDLQEIEGLSSQVRQFLSQA